MKILTDFDNNYDEISGIIFVKKKRKENGDPFTETQMLTI